MNPKSRIVSLHVLSSFAGTGCNLFFPPPLPPPTGVQAVFDDVWNTIDHQYSYFVYKKIDWNAVRNTHRLDFVDALTLDEFAAKIAVFPAELRDVHVNVEEPDSTPVGVFVKSWVPKFSSTPRNRCKASGYSVMGANVIHHAWIESGSTRTIGHFRVDTPDSNAFSGISESDIDDLFEARSA